MYNNDEAKVVHQIGQRERERERGGGQLDTHTQTHAHWLLQYKVELGEFYFSIKGTKTYFYIFCFFCYNIRKFSKAATNYPHGNFAILSCIHINHSNIFSLESYFRQYKSDARNIY